MEEKKMEEKLEKILYNVDFSKDTDLKERLARRLFETQSNLPGNVRQPCPHRSLLRVIPVIMLHRLYENLAHQVFRTFFVQHLSVNVIVDF